MQNLLFSRREKTPHLGPPQEKCLLIILLVYLTQIPPVLSMLLTCSLDSIYIDAKWNSNH